MSALSALVDRHHGPLLGYLYRLTDGDRALAEDLVQEAFLRMLGGIRGYQYPRPIKPFLYQIATNLVRDHFRSADARHTAPATLNGTDSGPSSSDEPQYVGLIDNSHTPEALEQNVIRGAAAQRATAALAALPEHQRLVIVLRYNQELSLNEIAETLDIPVGTVKSRLSLGLKTLRAMLEPSLEEHHE